MRPRNRKTHLYARRWRAGSIGLALFGAVLVSIDLIEPAFGQTCPGVNTAPCTVTPGSTINVTSASAVGLSASGIPAVVTANGITVNLAAAGTTGLLTQSGASINFDGSTLQTTATATANAATQTGFRASGAGSAISATGSSIVMGPPNGTTTANNMTGATAQNGASLALTNTPIQMLGGANGVSNHGLIATGANSQISFLGGIVTTLSRGSFAVWADNGGAVTLGNGAQFSTTGAQNTTGSVGSHALLATGANSQITGAGITVSTAGLLASGVRAESGGAIVLSNSTITTSSTSAADTDPSSAVRVLSGSSIQLSGSTITTTGQRGDGFSVQDPGSLATIAATTISVSGNRAPAGFIFNGGRAVITDSSLTSSNNTGVLVQDPGSSISLTNSAIASAGAVGYGLRVTLGGTADMVGGAVITSGRDGPAFAATNGTITATNVSLTTTGSDNAMGALADLNGRIGLTGGSVETFGDMVRSGARALGLAARNPGASVTATNTSVTTHGLEAFGVVADDGGSVTLAGNTIKTFGTTGIGLYAIVEQAGAQFPATITASTISIETQGIGAHGAMAAQNFLVAPATITMTDSSVVTHGDLAVGLRAVLAGTVNAIQSTVSTEGTAAHGLFARDNGSSVNVTNTDVRAVGATAHGSVAEAGGLITGLNSSVRATGSNSAALYVAGAPGFVSSANFTGSTLTNVSGPTIEVGGVGNVTLTNTTVSGSGEWLRVATINDFPRLAPPAPPPSGVSDPEGIELPTTGPLPTALPVVPGLANVSLSGSHVTGSAFTAPGSVSNVTLSNNSVWTMTGSSNVTNLTNDPSLIQYTPPTGDPTQLASYKTLTVVNYIGIGGVLGLNTYLGTDGSPSDRLVVNGGNASGLSPLRISNTIGPGALTTGNGILVVQATNGGTTNPGAFILAGPVGAGPYEYLLFHGGIAPGNENDWFLRSEASPAPPVPPNPPAPPEPPIPLFRPEDALYAKTPLAARQVALYTLGTFHERRGDQMLVTDERNGIGLTNAWGRGFGVSLDQRFSGVLSPSFSGVIAGFQTGVDLINFESASGHRDRIGPFAAFARADGDVRGFALGVINALAGKLPIDGNSIGATWTHFGPSGWYVDAVAMGTFYSAKPHSQRGIGADLSGNSVTLSLEAGVPLRLAPWLTLEPMGQLIWQRTHFDRSFDPFTSLDYVLEDSTYGRIGLRLEGDVTVGATRLQPYLQGNLWRAFNGIDQTIFNDVIPIPTPFGGTSVEVGGGITARLTQVLGLYAYGSYTKSVEGNFREAFAGQLGMRVNW